MVNFLWPRRRREAQPLWLLAVAARSRPRGGIAPENPGADHGGGIAMRPRLNALFAISVNSPSMSMVNFPCCVVSALAFSARGVTRRVTPQPIRAAVRMEAGVDAYL